MNKSIAYELRIGNYLHLNGRVVMVAGIHKKGDEINYQIKYYDTDGSEWGKDNFARDDEFKGIPITIERLLELGFEKFKDTGVYELLPLTYNKTTGLWWYNNTILDVIPQYIHQLQNIYFDLKGEILTKQSATQQ